MLKLCSHTCRYEVTLLDRSKVVKSAGLCGRFEDKSFANTVYIVVEIFMLLSIASRGRMSCEHAHNANQL